VEGGTIMTRTPRIAIIWTVFLSITFGVLLMPEVMEYHGFFRSLALTLTGVGVIWLAFFGVRSLVLHLSDDARRRDDVED